MPFTPVQRWGDYLVKRDDLWDESGIARGGKSRTAGIICRAVRELRKTGLAACLDRNSSVPGMLARVCEFNDLGLHLHIPAAAGELPPPFAEAKLHGAEIHEHRPGYMSVRRARLKEQTAADPGLIELGLGLYYGGSDEPECETARQTENIPLSVQRVIVPVGSGGMFRGILQGFAERSQPPRVIGIHVGTPPKIELPPWAELRPAKTKFGKDVRAELKRPDSVLPLDPAYEAKCVEFLKPGSLLWVVAHRDTE
jgi:Pyridoxal-phosphate dependent enzyme